MSFSNKTVVVTGASSGIGASIAILFAKEGADVAIVGRNEEKLADVAEKCAKVGKQPLVIKADVTKDDEAKQIIEKTIEKYGRIDVLVNNAGIGAMAKLDESNFVNVHDTIMNTNLRSAVMLTSLAVPYLIKTKGNIVNISCIEGSIATGKWGFGFASYSVSKAALNHFSRITASELAQHGVRVNVISPGAVKTNLYVNSGMPNVPNFWDEIKENNPIKVLTEPEEVADLVAYLAGDKAKSITGANYFIDAGISVL